MVSVNFPDPPEGIFDHQSGNWILTRVWACEMSDGRALLVHPGIISDGASIPGPLQGLPFVGPRFHPRTFASAFFHDCAYMSELVSRRFADAEFHRLLLMHGAGRTRARLYWSAVRSFGWIVWAKHTRESVDSARMFCELVEL